MNQKIQEYNIIIHDEHEILEELRKINKLGNNLNQIIRYFNNNGLMNNRIARDLKEVKQALWDAVMKFDAAVEKEYQPVKRN